MHEDSTRLLQVSGTILITGSTGFIGRLLVKRIIEERNGNQVVLILPVRNIDKAKSIYAQEIKLSDVEIHFIQTTMEEFDLCMDDMKLDYIIHCAAVTKSIEMISHPVEVADGIILGTRKLLELARRHAIKSFVYLSSMEVYGTVLDKGIPLAEEELGDISLTSTRSCYSLGKRIAEHYCHIFYEEYGVPVKIARLAQVFGKGVCLEDNRVFVQFARAVIHHQDLVLKTTGMSLGNYCESEEAIEGILTILQKGEDGEVYNIVNEANTMTIKEMAELVANKISDIKLQVICEEENPIKYGYAPNTGLRLSSEKLRNLGWKPRKSLEQMYEALIQELLSKGERHA